MFKTQHTASETKSRLFIFFLGGGGVRKIYYQRGGNFGFSVVFSTENIKKGIFWNLGGEGRVGKCSPIGACLCGVLLNIMDCF